MTIMMVANRPIELVVARCAMGNRGRPRGERLRGQRGK